MQTQIKILTIGLFLFVFITGSLYGQERTKTKDNSENVCIPGTNICLYKPTGYVIANKFPGIKNPTSGSFVIISELENSFPVIYQSFTAEKFQEQDMELWEKELIDFGEYQGILFKVSKQSGEVLFGKWILILGDDSSAIMINGTFPENFESEMSAEIESVVLSAYINDDKKVDGEQTVAYHVDVEGTKLSFAKSFPGFLVYTVDGVFPINSKDPVSFKVGSSLGRVSVKEPKEFAINQLESLPLDIEKGFEVNTMNLNDLSGYEIIAYGKEKVSGKRQIIYQVILYDKDSYYLMIGTAYNDYENNLSLFIDVSSSFMREIRN